ncbi:hypothetical protein [Natribacillus halophilus]|uniref:Uncharacterized protein n=1 Tax=Natribacillus halophilus TaxID=549003 RepID=A0A1G8QRD7_9BACI|nr:hypothetical protein [Natribacillus halophilus]SDJ07238.1 hypothetical protein SAMN04488123_11359 [Natribacillus halophilus]
MNQAGKVLIGIFVALAIVVSAGLLYMFVVGHDAEDDLEKIPGTEESTESLDVEDLSMTY